MVASDTPVAESTPTIRSVLELTPPRILLGAGMLTVSALSGKFGLGSEFLSIRFYATLAALVLLWPELRQVRTPPAVWSILAFLGYMALRSLVGAPASFTLKYVDIAYMAIQLFLTLAVARQHLILLAGSVLGIASIYLLVAIAGHTIPALHNPDSVGLGWGPLGTAITFSRIEFLAFCISLALTQHTRLAYGMAAVFLFATVASVMKAALLASLAALFTIVVTLAIARSWSNVVRILLVAATALLLFQLTFMSAVIDRIERVAVAQLQTEGVPLDRAAEGRFVVSARYCIFDANEALKCIERGFSDASQRAILVAEAISGFLERPLFGNGFDRYRVTTIHPGTHQPDPYTYPHNLLAEIAFEGGAVGLILLALALTMVIASISNSSAPLLIKASIGGFILFMLIAATFGGDLYDSRLLWLASIAVIATWRVAPNAEPASNSELDLQPGPYR